MKESQFSTACLVCKHVKDNSKTTRFVCSLADCFVAACSEHCLDSSGSDELSMVHVGHIDQVCKFPVALSALPVNVKMEKIGQDWHIGYFDNDEAEVTLAEGMFVAPPLGSELRDIHPCCLVYMFFNPTGEPLTLTLDEGTEIIPFWFDENNAKKFCHYIDNNPEIAQLTYGSLLKWASGAGIYFLAGNFLVEQFDYAIIAST